MNKLLKNLSDENYIKRLREDEMFAPIRDTLLENYDEYKDIRLESLRYSDYKTFFVDGTRDKYEISYFLHRRMLANFAVMSLIYGEAEHLEKLEDVIWAICDEFTWSLPAHARNNYEYDVNHIDLFSSETALTLSEILSLLEDKLSPIVADRIKKEIEIRIINSFLNKSFSWENACSNWAAVCGSGVAGAFMYIAPEKYPLIKKRIEGAMESFLSSYKADGVCREGLGYWTFGFGAFVCYAQLLYEFTGGKENLFDREHIRKIAEFGNRAYLTDGVSLSYGDSTSGSKFDFGLCLCLESFYPEIKTVHSRCNRASRWNAYIRSFEFYKPEEKTEAENDEYSFDESGIYIKKTPYYSFYIKGGNNGEPHNHNDVGCFVVASSDKQLICDIGAPRYVRDYFHGDRYSFLAASSRGHSVPVINGKLQNAGEDYYGILNTKCDGKVTVDFENAYEKGTVKGLKRSFDLKENSFILTDEFIFDNENNKVFERFVSLTKPEINDNIVKIDGLTFKAKSEGYEIRISSEEYMEHAHAKKEPRTLYIIDFVKENIGNNETFILEFNMN